MEHKAAGLIPEDDENFWPFLLQNLGLMIYFRVPTQPWFGRIIVNCGRISLIVIIFNVADYIFDFVSIVLTLSEI